MHQDLESSLYGVEKLRLTTLLSSLASLFEFRLSSAKACTPDLQSKARMQDLLCPEAHLLPSMSKCLCMPQFIN